MVDSLYSFDGGSIMTGLGSVPASPATSVTRGGGLLGSSTTSPFPIGRSQAQRSTSMEWGNGRSVLSAGVPVGGHYREGSIGLGGSTLGGGLCGSALSLAAGNMIGGGSNYSLLLANRCGRSVSPEVSVRKVSSETFSKFSRHSSIFVSTVILVTYVNKLSTILTQNIY